MRKAKITVCRNCGTLQDFISGCYATYRELLPDGRIFVYDIPIAEGDGAVVGIGCCAAPDPTNMKILAVRLKRTAHPDDDYWGKPQ